MSLIARAAAAVNIDLGLDGDGAAGFLASPLKGLEASNPIKSEIFVSIAMLIFALITLQILRFYLPLRSTPAYLIVPVFFALFLPANIVLLVPIDLASSAQTDDEATRGIWLPQTILRVSWRITYWLTFVLTWFILPILAEYSDAGYRAPKDRILYSLRSNAQYHAMVFGSGIIGLAYVIVMYGFSVDSLKGLVMALAYVWGLVLAIYLMGHGLVAIPRRLIRTATPSRRLRRLQSQAPKLNEKLEESEMDLEEIELQVVELGQRKTGSALDYREWIEEINEGISLADSNTRTGGTGIGSRTSAASADDRIVPTVITKKYMADLTRRLVRARHARSRYASEWSYLLQRYSETQAVLNSATHKRLELPKPKATDTLWDRVSILSPYQRYLVYYHVVPLARMLFGVILALASACIVWSELVKAALPEASVIRLTVVHHWTGDKGQVGFAGQLIATGWILYMCAAALISITEVKVWRGRALVKRNTAHESAFWYASQVARLSIPLSYNFMTFLSSSIYKKTVFFNFLGRLITFTRLGTWFDYLLPTFILFPVLATLFGLYGRVRRFFGYGTEFGADDDEDEDYDEDGRLRNYGTGSWREGRDLLERELNGTSIRQRRQEAAGRLGAGDTAAGGRHGPVMVVPGGRRNGPAYEDDPEDILSSSEGANPTTPFAVSPSSSGILPTAPSARTRTLGTAGGASSSSGRRQNQAQQRPYYDEEDEEDDNIFQQLGHRMKNTMGTIEAPKWFQEIGQGFKKPKWMSGDNDDAAGSSSNSNAPAPANDNGIRRWFGGNNEGRIRL
ncbi:uncharacterized protein SPSK_07068 [Sporothrix schenckii 1099-18]|uniref:Uncharacterized protein n=2 Tax=Sporothrix schenckii TaxID=29908 RepID=U7Q497_SPOS1|nr:uncharacterized protein SPSK_07068 [Sporothrix schenckii 1099-18]ERT01521.1 hypothetical protein HMPREF1624_02772 [Sporothrix schenckii ATCC 58251]KJR88726.1 hypothetical protein SPSK_07068 [Sporothrix schenckii 1099-18]